MMDQQPNRDAEPLWDVEPAWEGALDALARPAFLVTPPADVQQAILAAVLQAAADVPRPILIPVAAAAPRPAAVAVASQPTPAPAPERAIPLSAYLLLAAVLVAYLAALSWVQGLIGGGGWLPTLMTQLLAASEVVVGRLPTSEPLALTWLVLQRAPWIALLPLAWLLWERDRAASPAA